MYTQFIPAKKAVKDALFKHGISTPTHKFIAMQHLYPNLIEAYGFPNLETNNFAKENISPRTITGIARLIQNDAPEIFGKDYISESGLKKLIERYFTHNISRKTTKISKKKKQNSEKEKKILN
ncbi:MAG: hypothetical protein KC589_11240 [Nanoarchaeota archaeon]|nr:hypothetical protein [Nanoarchaeota archaeon]